MNKVWLVIKREYLTRVRNKTFLLSTFLLPIMFILFIFGSVYFASSSRNSKKTVAVINDPGSFKGSLNSDSAKVVFDFAGNVDTLNYMQKGYDAVLDLAAVNVKNNYSIYSQKQIGIDNKDYIERQISKAIENDMLLKSNISRIVLDSIRVKTAATPGVENKVRKEGGKMESVNEGRNSMIGMLCGVLIYITMFVFGAMVMRGVMEEKTNRIAEVMVSSLKPFQLMLGKIVGIACVGLTQLLLWIVLMSVLTSLSTAFISGDTIAQFQQMQQSGQMPTGGQGGMALQMLNAKQTFLGSINWGLIIPSFIFYFLGGYLFYAALFAAVGSVINEDPQEAQSLMLPITMPIVFGFIILSTNLNKPDSPAMFWGSMIPFTSPIVMMGRIPSGTVPVWQLLLSMLLMVAGFLFTTWLAAKIYRTGILLYGKKVTWKEMWKWAFRKS